jgi:hypothetical protein
MIFILLSIYFVKNKSIADEMHGRDISKEGMPQTLGKGWRIPGQSLLSHDIPVVKADVFEFGAIGDGITDDTQAFQKGIDALFKNGGGTLWVPAGEYAFHGNLVLKPNVVIRGEWIDPSTNNYKVEGTILKVYSGKEDVDGQAFITMYPVTAVQYLNFWYPEQAIGGEMIPYPPTLQNKVGYDINSNMTVENVTFVNSWKGIEIGPEQNTLWTIRNVNGFPLQTGIETDDTMDVGRLHSVCFKPEFWVKSGLRNSPKNNSYAIRWVYNNGIAILIRKHDFVSYSDFYLRGYHIGLAGDYLGEGGQVEERMKEFGNAFFQGHFYNIDIADCKVALRIKALLAIGVYFSGSSLIGDECGVLIEEDEIHPVGFVECVIGGNKQAIINKGNVYLSLTACKLDGLLDFQGGALSMLDCSIESNLENHIELGAGLKTARLNTIKTKGKLRIKNHSDEEKVILFNELKESVKRLDPHYKHTTAYQMRTLKPKVRALKVYDGLPGPIQDRSEDHTSRTQKYLDDLAKEGGGILFFPAGYYSFYGSLHVPANVELRGVVDIPLHATRPGTTFNVLTKEGSDKDTAFITLNEQSGLKGICFNYPNQDYLNVRSYPYTVRGKGAGIYIQNLTSSSNTHFIDLGTYQCDEHFVDYVSGCPLKTGIFVGGGSKNGRIYNSQFIGHYWWLYDTVFPKEMSSNWVSEQGNFPIPSWFEGKFPEKKGAEGKVFDYQMKNLNAFVVGDVEKQILFHNFSYGHLRGLYTIDQGAGGPDALILLHGSDRSACAVDIQALSEDRNLTLVAFMSYANDLKKGTNIRMGKGVKGTVKFLDSEIGGHHWNAVDMEAGQLYINQSLISLLEGGIHVSEEAKLTINNPFLLFGSKYKKPTDLYLENVILRNYYFLEKQTFVNK